MLINRLLICAILLAALDGCGNHQDAAPTANPMASSTSAAAPLPASAPDSTTASGMSKPLSADQVKVSLEPVGQPQLSSDGNLITILLKISNHGNSPLLPSGPYPVNLGARSLDASGRIANGELARAGIPPLSAGSTVNAAIAIPAAEVKGKKVQILLVQENAGWFDSWGMLPLTVGPL